MAFLTIPLMMTMYIMNIIFDMFIPIAGQMPLDLSPELPNAVWELIIGGFAAISSMAYTSYITPLVTIMRKPYILILALACASVTGFIIFACTDVI